MMTTASASLLIPETAPFSHEQRAWLNGFLAGLMGLSGSKSPIAAQPATAPVKAVAEVEAEEDFPWHDPALEMDERLKLAEGQPIARRMMAAMAQLDCGACGYVCRTYAEAIADGSESDITRCSPGGGPTAKVLKTLKAQAVSVSAPAPFPNVVAPSFAEAKRTATPRSHAEPKTNRSNPLKARIASSVRLTHRDADKDTRHVVVEWESSSLAYEPGDSLGVFPVNCAELTDSVIHALHARGDEPTAIAGPSGPLPLRRALSSECSLNRVGARLLTCLADSASDPGDADELRRLADSENDEFLGTADVLDVLLRFPSARPDPKTFADALDRLQPRLYSISSSLKAHPSQAHLTIGVVRYQAAGRQRKGTASHYLGVRLFPGDNVRVFVHSSPKFRLPNDPDAPIIMIGPGTGIAPFRAFLQERQAVQAQGKSWLFFGNQYADRDFLYREELDAFQRQGTLSRLDLAFSRQTTDKAYVQHRMSRHAGELYRWLEDGASVYVCGDAKRMAKDVDETLKRIISEQGKRSLDQAKEMLAGMAKAGRYCRDVY